MICTTLARTVALASCKPTRTSFRLKSSKNAFNKHANLDAMIADLPKTCNQVKYCEMLKDDRIPLVLATGPAGSGKTLQSISSAIHKLIKGDTKKVVITRPTVAVGEELGFLPGNLQEKMHPFLIPVFDSFKEYITAQRLNEYIKNDEIEIAAIAHIRGRTFHDCWVVVDEAQNLSQMQFRTLLTRMGQNSKMVVSGDLDQSDIREKNGHQDFIERYRLSIQENGPNPHIDLVEFGNDDIMRSEIVKHVLDIYKY